MNGAEFVPTEPEEKPDMPQSELDPAEFLFAHKEYHDCVFTVGDPATDEVEKIGVSSAHLVAQSSVFREWLGGSGLADPSGANTHVTDVSPAIFRLMLTHVYGGKLPDMPLSSAVQLAMCADKYNIVPLVKTIIDQLAPTSVEEVFPALRLLANISRPHVTKHLEGSVVKIIQEQTRQLIENKEFLQIDENCLTLIVKQQSFNVSKLDLLKSLVKWGEHKMKLCPDMSLQLHLKEILKKFDLTSFTLDEILDHVLHLDILTPEELMQLMKNFAEERAKNLRLCIEEEKKSDDGAKEMKNSSSQTVPRDIAILPKVKSVFYSSIEDAPCYKRLSEHKSWSTFDITTDQDVLLENFYCAGLTSKKEGEKYSVMCSINIDKKYSSGLIKSVAKIKFKNEIFKSNVAINIPTINDDSLPVFLKANYLYQVKVVFNQPHPVFENQQYDDNAKVVPRYEEQVAPGLKVKFYNAFHVFQIAYKF